MLNLDHIDSAINSLMEDDSIRKAVIELLVRIGLCIILYLL